MNLPTHSGFYRKLTLISYVSLLLFVVLWQTLLVPSEHLSRPLALVIFVLPLLLPLRGILMGNPYTHAWANFILMLYFLHGFTTIYTMWDRWYLPLTELILTTGTFFGATYYARYRGRELGLGLKKQKVGNAGKAAD